MRGCSLYTPSSLVFVMGLLGQNAMMPCWTIHLCRDLWVRKAGYTKFQCEFREFLGVKLCSWKVELTLFSMGGPRTPSSWIGEGGPQNPAKGSQSFIFHSGPSYDLATALYLEILHFVHLVSWYKSNYWMCCEHPRIRPMAWVEMDKPRCCQMHATPRHYY